MVNSKGRPPVESERGDLAEVAEVIVESFLDIHEGLIFKMCLVYFVRDYAMFEGVECLVD